jgi:hypothetical protein
LVYVFPLGLLCIQLYAHMKYKQSLVIWKWGDG